MKFAVGYQLFEGDGGEPCLNWIREYSQDIDNQRFPENWFERVSSCHGECMDCDYCRRVLERVLVKLPLTGAGAAGN